MSLSFTTTTRHFSFLDPFSGFQRKDLEIEVRRDPLSGDVARILEFRARDLGPIDHSLFLERQRQAGLKCPFCSENIGKMASRFLPEQVPEGHLTRGEAVLFPNAFPYETMNSVLVLTKEHYVEPGQFTAEILANGFMLAREAFLKLAKDMFYASVNWNYMMPAGAGIIHPHFQLAAGKTPTRYQDALRRKARVYARKHPGSDLAAAYLAHERQDGSRWLGRLGPAGWAASFAPRAIFDIVALVPGGKGLCDLKPAQVDKLAQGLAAVLRYFQAKGVSAFNMALHTSLKSDACLPLMLRLVSRIEIPPMGVDEINYFEKLHDEMLTFVRPEKVAAEIRPFWP
jgi:UDPglucose--hexose-1-phosphate uridylyltransferase